MIPQQATHHELGPNGHIYYDASSFPHKKWMGAAWFELGRYADVTQWATPIDQECKVKKSSAANTYRTYATKKEYKYD